MKYIEIKAPAKINIGLNVVKKRDDGFHDLETFFYPIYDLFDQLSFELADHFSFECDREELKDENENLVVKAHKLIEDYIGKRLLVKIKLTKNIPTGAGLGGGSSDAAATLISLNELFNLKISYENLRTIALQLGSDVPFFIKAKPAIGRLRGEKLTIVDFELPYNIVIVNPGIHISTKEAFKNIHPKSANIDYSKVFQSQASFLKNSENVINDFEEYVFTTYPSIKEIKEKLLEQGAIFSLMSGSGSTVYGFFREEINMDHFTSIFPPNYFICFSRMQDNDFSS